VAGTPLLTREPSLSHDTAAHARKRASAILSTEQTKSLLTPRGLCACCAELATLQA
jgi:hypothetical protein